MTTEVKQLASRGQPRWWREGKFAQHFAGLWTAWSGKWTAGRALRLDHARRAENRAAEPRGRAAPGAISLLTAQPGAQLTLVAINGQEGVRRRLHELGLIPGSEFRVLQSSGGPLLLAVRDSRLALGRKTAQHLLVAPKDQRHG